MSVLGKVFAVIGWLFAGLLALFFLGVCAMIGASLGSLGEREYPVIVTKTDRAVGVVELKGEIISSEEFRRSYDALAKNDRIKAIVVRIESPGGSVGASEEIYRLIKESAKPAVCSLGNVAASGGLYAAVGCKKIVVNEGTLTGSIGVIMVMPNLEAVIDRFGLQMNVVKSGKFKDTGSPFRPLNDEDRTLLQELIENTYEQFVQVIAESRALSVEQVKAFADGRIILGEQAVELGLADEVGGLELAAKLALQMADPDAIGEPEIIQPKRQRGILSVFDDVSQNRLFHWFATSGKVRLLYQAYL